MKTLLFLGDSITDCNHCFEPKNLGFGYVRMIHEALNSQNTQYQIINKGNDGFTVPSVCRLYKNTCTAFSPDLITLLVGINDLAVIQNTGITETVGLADFRLRYQALIDQIRNTFHGPVVLMEPFIFPHPAEYSSWEPTLLEMNGIIRNLAVQNDLFFLPLMEMLKQNASLVGISSITTDGIHLTSRGHQLIADQWLQNLPKFLPHSLPPF